MVRVNETSSYIYRDTSRQSIFGSVQCPKSYSINIKGSSTWPEPHSVLVRLSHPPPFTFTSTQTKRRTGNRQPRTGNWEPFRRSVLNAWTDTITPKCSLFTYISSERIIATRTDSTRTTKCWSYIVLTWLLVRFAPSMPQCQHSSRRPNSKKWYYTYVQMGFYLLERYAMATM